MGFTFFVQLFNKRKNQKDINKYTITDQFSFVKPSQELKNETNEFVYHFLYRGMNRVTCTPNQISLDDHYSI